MTMEIPRKPTAWRAGTAALAFSALPIVACGGATWQEQLADDIRDSVAESGCSDAAMLAGVQGFAEGLVEDTTLGDWGGDPRYPYIPDDVPMSEVLDVSFAATEDVCG